MPSKPTTVDEYLAAMPEKRRAMVSAIRDVINANKPDEVEECIQYGMLGWVVPHRVHPDGYHADPKQPVPYVHLANQKRTVSLYLFCLYIRGDLRDWFRDRATRDGRRLDMGKSCVRFKKMEDIPLELLGEALRRMPLETFLENYLAGIPASKRS